MPLTLLDITNSVAMNWNQSMDNEPIDRAHIREAVNIAQQQVYSDVKHLSSVYVTETPYAVVNGTTYVELTANFGEMIKVKRRSAPSESYWPSEVLDLNDWIRSQGGMDRTIESFATNPHHIQIGTKLYILPVFAVTDSAGTVVYHYPLIGDMTTDTQYSGLNIRHEKLLPIRATQQIFEIYSRSDKEIAQAALWGSIYEKQLVNTLVAEGVKREAITAQMEKAAR